MFGLGQKSSDRAFYDAFSAHAARSVEAAKLIVEMLKEPGRSVELGKIVNEVESAGDKITHETIARLHQTWITPIDGSDIHSLITSLDDVLDTIEAVSERLVLYGITESPAFVAKLAGVVVRGTEAMDKAVRLLPQVKRPKEILDLCVEINRLENEADKLVRKAVADLFVNEKDPIAIIKLKEVYDFLEATTDFCEDVADTLQTVVVKNS